MGCVSSSLLNTDDDDFTRIGTTSLGHHIVSLTSTTYGLLSLDHNPNPNPNPTTPPPRLTLSPSLPSPRSIRLDSPEVINSWELMAGLDPTSDHSFRFSNPLFPPSRQNPNPKPNPYASCLAKDKFFPTKGENRVHASCVAKYAEEDGFENSNPNLFASCAAMYAPDGYHKLCQNRVNLNASCTAKYALDGFEFEKSKPSLTAPSVDYALDGFEFEKSKPSLTARSVDLGSSGFERLVNASSVAKKVWDGFEKLCPPKGENRVVIYTTTLRGVRKTFEACNAVRAAMEGLGVAVCERDVSMDRGFREELRELMKGKDGVELVPPRVFVRGRYVGGAEEVMRVLEDGFLGELLKGLPKAKIGVVCEGCGGARFLPCFSCNGSCKRVMGVKEEKREKDHSQTVVVRCPDCNENGLVLCPICS